RVLIGGHLAHLTVGERLKSNYVRVEQVDDPPEDLVVGELPPARYDEVPCSSPDSGFCGERVLDRGSPGNTLNGRDKDACACGASNERDAEWRLWCQVEEFGARSHEEQPRPARTLDIATTWRPIVGQV